MTRSVQMILLGVLLALAGYLILVVSGAFDGSGVGLLVAVLLLSGGGVVTQIGVIGAGVRLGLLDHEERTAAH